MHEQKVALFLIFLLVYLFYNITWFNKGSDSFETTENISVKEKLEALPKVVQDLDVTPQEKQEIQNETIRNETVGVKPRIKTKTIPLHFKNACSILQIFTEKPQVKIKKLKPESMTTDQSAVTAVAIIIFLVILVINAILDVIKVKEEEKAKRLHNPNGERRPSLSEFANKKPLKRGSSSFGFQLFQIAEATTKEEKEDANRNEKQSKARPLYTRGQSINSYLSEKNLPSDGSVPASKAETTNEPKLVKRQSVSKLFGTRPTPMVRRSSFPALPLNPDVQAAMLSHRQASVDSDDESDGRGRRVRIIRRY